MKIRGRPWKASRETWTEQTKAPAPNDSSGTIVEASTTWRQTPSPRNPGHDASTGRWLHPGDGRQRFLLRTKAANDFPEFARPRTALWRGLPTSPPGRPKVSKFEAVARGRPSVPQAAGSGDPRRTLTLTIEGILVAEDETDESLTTVGNDVDVEIKEMMGLLDAPAFARRGQELEDSLRRLRERCRQARLERLDMVYVRLRQLAREVTGPEAWSEPLHDVHRAAMAALRRRAAPMGHRTGPAPPPAREVPRADRRRRPIQSPMGPVSRQFEIRSGQFDHRQLQSLLSPGEGVRDGLGTARRPVLHARAQAFPRTAPSRPPSSARPGNTRASRTKRMMLSGTGRTSHGPRIDLGHRSASPISPDFFSPTQAGPMAQSSSALARSSRLLILMTGSITILAGISPGTSGVEARVDAKGKGLAFEITCGSAVGS